MENPTPRTLSPDEIHQRNRAAAEADARKPREIKQPKKNKKH